MYQKSILTGFLLGILLLTGCSGNLDSFDNNTMTIEKDGTIQDVSVEDFSDGDYDMDNLESFISEEVTDYNTSAGAEHITLVRLETENKLAKLQLNYLTMEDYNSFNHTDYVLTSFADAVISGNVTSVSDGSRIAVTDIEDKEYQVLKVTDAMNITVQGSVLYYNSYVTEEDGVFVSSGKGTVIIIFQ